MSNEYHIKVWRIKKGKRSQGMWAGVCSCGYWRQYWHWGATIGTMLHHNWKEHGHG